MNEQFVYQAVLNGDLEIREDGTIWRLRKRRINRWTNHIYSAPCKVVRAERCLPGSSDYLRVRAMIHGKRLDAMAARLVYHHFKGPIPSGLTVNHENGNKQDNRPENLTLATISEQAIHLCYVLKKGRAITMKGENVPWAKLTTEDVVAIRSLWKGRGRGPTQRSIGERFGIHQSHVSAIARQVKWRHVP